MRCAYCYSESNSYKFYLLRYEVNPKLIKDFESNGFAFIGRDAEQGNRMEIGELIRPIASQKTGSNRTAGDGAGSLERRHPYFVGTQFHPEYTSRPMSPSPFFLGLVLSAHAQCGRSDSQLKEKLDTDLLIPHPWHFKQPASMSYNSLFPIVKKA